MTSGVRWDERYGGRASDLSRFYSAPVEPGLGATVSYMRGLPAEAAPGTTWGYKTGETHLEEVHLLSGIGGKATALLSGDVESVRVAVEAGAAFAAGRDRLARQVVIPRPDPSILPFLRPHRSRSLR